MASPLSSSAHVSSRAPSTTHTRCGRATQRARVEATERNDYAGPSCLRAFKSQGRGAGQRYAQQRRRQRRRYAADRQQGERREENAGSGSRQPPLPRLRPAARLRKQAKQAVTTIPCYQTPTPPSRNAVDRRRRESPPRPCKHAREGASLLWSPFSTQLYTAMHRRQIQRS